MTRHAMGADLPSPWILSPAEYAAASAEYDAARIVGKNVINPCEVAQALDIFEGERCSPEAENYSKQILKEFKAARAAVPDSDFTIRDYESAFSSNYPSNLSEPGISYAACAVAFDDAYGGEPSDAERLMPGHLVCTPSMVRYGKLAIERFDKAIKAELLAK